MSSRSAEAWLLEPRVSRSCVQGEPSADPVHPVATTTLWSSLLEARLPEPPSRCVQRYSPFNVQGPPSLTSPPPPRLKPSSESGNLMRKLVGLLWNSPFGLLPKT